MINWPHAEATLDAIDAASPECGFDMSTYDCGTSRCIAGWAAHLAGLDTRKSLPTKIFDTAADFLGVPPGEAWRLFTSDAFLRENAFGVYIIDSHPSTADIRTRLKELDSQ